MDSAVAAPACGLARAGGWGARDLLVVDDQEDNARLVIRYLTSHGFGVRWAASGEAALEEIVVHRPALILLDVMMPGISGFELCRRLKADPETLSIPVVLITGLCSRDDRVRGIEAGADDFLSKPLYREELLARVRSLTRLTEARHALEEARLAIEIERREHIHRTFERYVSPKIVREILNSRDAGENLLSRQTRQEAVALFADLRGFTRMSELLDVDTVVMLLNGFFSALTEITYAFEGTVFNMAGDSLLVGFGVPLFQHDAAHRAVAAACAMQRRFTGMAQEWLRVYNVHVGLGIGVNLGNVIVGNVGSPTYMSYTMIGDAVNVAARLMQVAGGNEILLSPSMLGAVVELGIEPDVLSPIALKGKAQPLDVFRIPPSPSLPALN